MSNSEREELEKRKTHFENIRDSLIDKYGEDTIRLIRDMRKDNIYKQLCKK